mgnify:FL=1
MGGPDLRLVDHTSLARYMDYRGFSVRSLAARTGVNRSTIGHLRSGKRNTCGPEAAKAIARALDVPVDMLFADRSLLRFAHNNAAA